MLHKLEYLKLYENFSNPVLDLNKEFKDYRYVTQVRNAIKDSLDRLNIPYNVFPNSIIVRDFGKNDGNDLESVMSSDHIAIIVDEILYVEHGHPIGSDRRVRVSYKSDDSSQMKNLKELLSLILKRSPEYITNDALKKINESSVIKDKLFSEYSNTKDVEKLITDSFNRLNIN